MFPNSDTIEIKYYIEIIIQFLIISFKFWIATDFNNYKLEFLSIQMILKQNLFQIRIASKWFYAKMSVRKEFLKNMM